MQCVSGVPALGRKYGEGVVNGTGADVYEERRRRERQRQGRGVLDQQLSENLRFWGGGWG